MTPGNGGDRRPSGLSRRRLLAGIGGVGAVGMASGIGTGAFLSDRDSFPGNGLGAGSVELTVDDELTDGRVTVDVSGIGHGPDERGSDSFRVGVRTNPARVWLAAECPAADSDFADALAVDVLVDGRSVTGGLGPLAAAVAKLVDGERIDDDCLGPDDGITVEVVAELPADAPDSLSGNTASLSLGLYAEQCRHVSEDEAGGSNPFAGRVCEGNQCVPCADENDIKIGGITLRYLGDETVDPLIVRAAGGGGGGNGRGNGNNPPTTIFDATVRPNEEFALDGADAGTNTPGWIGPNIYLDSDGGESRDKDTETNIHTSCSVPLSPGDVYGDFEVVAAMTTTGEPLCGTEEN